MPRPCERPRHVSIVKSRPNAQNLEIWRKDLNPQATPRTQPCKNVVSIHPRLQLKKFSRRATAKFDLPFALLIAFGTTADAGLEHSKKGLHNQPLLSILQSKRTIRIYLKWSVQELPGAKKIKVLSRAFACTITTRDDVKARHVLPHCWAWNMPSM